MLNYLLHARSRPDEPPGDTLLPHIQIFCDSITTMFIKYVHILPAMSVVMKIPNKPQVSIAPFSSIILHWSAHGGHPRQKRTDLLLLKTFRVINLFIWSTFFSVTIIVDFF